MMFKYDCVNKDNGYTVSLDCIDEVVKDHEKNCPYEIIKCPIQKCNDQCIKKDMDIHKVDFCEFT